MMPLGFFDEEIRFDKPVNDAIQCTVENVHGKKAQMKTPMDALAHSTQRGTICLMLLLPH